MSATLTVISWRDIPAQVVAKRGRETARSELHPRFQAAIDRAAMAAGLAGTDDYLAQWHRDTRPCEDDIEAAVEAEVQRLEEAFPNVFLQQIATAGGLRSGAGKEGI